MNESVKPSVEERLAWLEGRTINAPLGPSRFEVERIGKAVAQLQMAVFIVCVAVTAYVLRKEEQ